MRNQSSLPWIGIAVGLGVVGVTTVLAACGGDVVVDTSSGASAATGGSGGSPTRGQGGGVSGAGGNGPCTLTTSGAGGAGVEQVSECFAPPGASCPSLYDAAEFIIPADCTYLVSVDCGPVVQGGMCCYETHEQSHPCGE